MYGNERIIQELKSLKQNSSPNGCLSYMLLSENKNEAELIKPNQYCFASMDNKAPFKNHPFQIFCYFFSKFKLEGNRTRRKTFIKEERKYVDYLVNRSMFAPCFENKNITFHINEGAIMNTKFHPSIHITAAVFDRYRAEYPQIVTSWNKAVKAGLNEDAALFFASIFQWNSRNRVFCYYPVSSGHTVFYAQNISPQYLENWLNRKCSLPDPANATLSFSTRYAGFSKMWGPSGFHIFKLNQAVNFINKSFFKKATLHMRTIDCITSKDVVAYWDDLLERHNIVLEKR